MIMVIRIGRKCGAKIFSGRARRLCAKCVLKTALMMPPEAPVALVTTAAPLQMLKRTRPLLPIVKKQRGGRAAGRLGDTIAGEIGPRLVRVWYFAPAKESSIEQSP